LTNLEREGSSSVTSLGRLLAAGLALVVAVLGASLAAADADVPETTHVRTVSRTLHVNWRAQTEDGTPDGGS
jgi:hypothetical protein